VRPQCRDIERQGTRAYLASIPHADQRIAGLKPLRDPPITVYPSHAERAPTMFAPAASIATAQRQAGAYRQVHVATGVDGASPHDLVSMLFDGLVGAIAEARGALRSGNVVLKGRAIGRAVSIVGEGLSACLNLGEGGKLAGDLHALYAYITLRLTHANLHNDEAALEECTRLIEPVRSAWSSIQQHA
jgi:flagellar protein FliS